VRDISLVPHAAKIPCGEPLRCKFLVCALAAGEREPQLFLISPGCGTINTDSPRMRAGADSDVGSICRHESYALAPRAMGASLLALQRSNGMAPMSYILIIDWS